MSSYLKSIDATKLLQDLWHRKEAFIWIAALVMLALSNPVDHHYTLCPFHNLGWEFCPGCGLGRSIAFMFRLRLKESFLAHPLGMVAAGMLIYRIVALLRTFQINYLPSKPINYGQSV